MRNLSTRLTASWWQLLLVACVFFGRTGWAQAPAWTMATGNAQLGNPQVGGYCQAMATTLDAAGNVFVAGYFNGTVSFGTTILSNVGGALDEDLFVAKYVPSTGTWAWAQRGGGIYSDEAYGIAVSGNSIYLTGVITNDQANSCQVGLGGTTPATSPVPVNGASGTISGDLLVAKYTDNGTSATLNWTQVGGGTNGDRGTSIAVNGALLYVTGAVENTRANTNAVVFGGNGTTAGTVPVNGASITSSADLLVTKYTDNGNSATLNWTQVGGGTGNDYGTGLAVNGTSVYVTGAIQNTTSNTNAVVLGGTGTAAGTTQVDGASATSSADLLVAKYTDNGNSATLAWTQVGGGTDGDYGQDIAVRNANVYVTGAFINTKTNTNAVVLGGSGTTAGSVQVNGASANAGPDVLVAKYTDLGNSATLSWTQVGGGSSADRGYRIAVVGTSVFVAGGLNTNTANSRGVMFGGSGTTLGTVAVSGVSSPASQDAFIARYTDQGASATFNWAQVGGGSGYDEALGLAVGSNSVLVVGKITPPASFGPYTTPVSSGSAAWACFVAGLGGTALPVHPATSPLTGLTLAPNPAVGRRTLLRGAVPSSTVQVHDVVGRLVLTASTAADGTTALALPASLPTGIYVVRAGQAVTRLVID